MKTKENFKAFMELNAAAHFESETMKNINSETNAYISKISKFEARTKEVINKIKSAREYILGITSEDTKETIATKKKEFTLKAVKALLFQHGMLDINGDLTFCTYNKKDKVVKWIDNKSIDKNIDIKSVVQILCLLRYYMDKSEEAGEVVTIDADIDVAALEEITELAEGAKAENN